MTVACPTAELQLTQLVNGGPQAYVFHLEKALALEDSLWHMASVSSHTDWFAGGVRCAICNAQQQINELVTLVNPRLKFRLHWIS